MAEFDISIIGAGPAGASAALGLANLGFSVALLDRKRPGSIPTDGKMDPRVVAISPGSMAWLEQIGAAQHLQQDRMAPFYRMRVCSGQQSLEFVAEEHGLDQLGWIIEIANLNDALWQAAGHHHQQGKLERIIPGEIDQFRLRSDRNRLTLSDGRSVRSHILIGADGARSQVRDAAGIEWTVDDYNQRAIVTPLASNRPNTGMAWQRFTGHGPLALLPLPDQGSSLVWSVPFDRADELLAMDDDEFLAALNQAAIDPPFGELTSVGARHALPLARRQSRQLVFDRVALIGDAARSVHPLAGQGMNLGLADAAELVHCLDGWDTAIDPETRLARFARRRLSDSSLIAGGIHLINESQMFGALPRQLGMGAAFKLLSRSRLAREPFVRRACGI